MNQDLPRGFLASVVADKSLSLAQVKETIKNAREVHALCHLTGFPAGELLNRRATMEQARAAIRAGEPRKNAAAALAKTRAAVDTFANGYWADKRPANSQAPDPDESDTELNRRAFEYWYQLQ